MQVCKRVYRLNNREVTGTLAFGIEFTTFHGVAHNLLMYNKTLQVNVYM